MRQHNKQRRRFRNKQNSKLDNKHEVAFRLHTSPVVLWGLSERMRQNYSEICNIFCCHPIVGHLLSSPVTRVSGTRLCTLGSSTPDMETWSTEQPAELNWAILFKTDSTSKSNTMHFNSFLPLSCRQFFFVQSSQSFWVIIVPHGLWHNCTIVWLKRSWSGSQPIFPAYQAESFMSGPGRGHQAVIGCRLWSILPDPSSRRLGRMR